MLIWLFRSQTSLVVQRVTGHKLKKQVKYQLCFVKSLHHDCQLSFVGMYVSILFKEGNAKQ